MCIILVVHPSTAIGTPVQPYSRIGEVPKISGVDGATCAENPFLTKRVKQAFQKQAAKIKKQRVRTQPERRNYGEDTAQGKHEFIYIFMTV